MRALLIFLFAACGHKSESPPPRIATGSGDFVIVDVTVVPMDREGTVPHQTVVVRDGNIVAVAPAQTVDVAPGAKSVDGKGKWLMPGLADMHVHTWNESDLTMFVAAGVTTVRNMFGSEQHLGWRKAIESGKQFGPTIVTATPILDGDPPVWPGSIVLTKPEEVDGIVAGLKGQGYDFLKPYARLSAPVYDALVAAGKKHGMTLQGHVPKAVGLEHVIESGQKSVEHLDGWFNALAPKTEETSAPTTDFWKQLADVLPRVDESKIPAVVDKMKKANAYNCPTLIVTSRMAALDDLPKLEQQVKWLSLISPEVRSMWDPKRDFRLTSAKADDFATMRKANAVRKKIVAALAAANAPIIVGTDTGNPYVLPGEGMHDEIELLVDAGMPRAKVMRAATAGAAEFLGLANRSGVVAVGARADLLLVSVDPLTTAIPLQPDGVVLRGKWLPKSELDTKLADLSKRPADRFEGMAALVPEGKDVVQVHFELKSGDKVIGEERLAIGKPLVVVAQSVNDIPGRIETTYRIAKDASSLEMKTTFGKLAMEGKVEGDKFVGTGEDSSGKQTLPPVPMPAKGFLNGPGVGGSYMLLAQIADMKPGEKRKAASVELSPFPRIVIQPATYDIERKPDTDGHRVYAMTIHFGEQAVESELVADDKGVVSQKYGAPIDVTFVRR